MKSIVLERAIPVRSWRVIGEVSQAERRTELTPVLLRAHSPNGTNEDDVAGHLLFESRSRRPVAKRLLEIARQYGLLQVRDGRFTLTPSGEEALASGHVFVPELGSWVVWATDDPLVRDVLLRVEPWLEPSAYDEVLVAERETGSTRRFEALPAWLHATVGKSLSVLGGARGRSRIERLELDGEGVDPVADVRATWDVGAGRLRLLGSLGGAKVDTSIDAPGLTLAQVWEDLLNAEGLASRWDATRSAILAAFEETTSAEREMLRRELPIKRPVVRGLGPFLPLTIPQVPLRPWSAEDAARWAQGRLRQRVRDYATAERFAAWIDESVAPFAEFRPAVAGRAELATAAWVERGERPTPYAWRLMAAEDWRL